MATYWAIGRMNNGRWFEFLDLGQMSEEGALEIILGDIDIS